MRQSPLSPLEKAGSEACFHASFETMKSLFVTILILSSGCTSNQALKGEVDAASHGQLRTRGAPASINAAFRKDDLNIDTWTQRFEGESREVYRAREAIVSVLGLKRGEVVADVGAGSGLFLAYLSKAVGEEGEVIAVDIAPVFVEHIRARAKAAGLENVRSQLGEQSDVKLKEASVDLIFTCDTYHHFEDPDAILKTIRKALKPGGRFAVIDYHRIAGKTRPFLMEHVRAGKEVFAAEIESAGFSPLPSPETPFLEENYLMLFER